MATEALEKKELLAADVTLVDGSIHIGGDDPGTDAAGIHQQLVDHLTTVAADTITDFVLSSDGIISDVASTEFLGEEAAQAAYELLSEQFDFPDGEATRQALAAAGFDIDVRVTVQDVHDHLVDGRPLPNDLLMLTYSGNQSTRTKIGFSGTRPFEVGTAQVMFSGRGQIDSGISTTASFEAGVDSRGRVYIIEGGVLTAGVQGSGSVDSHAESSGSVTAQASGTATANVSVSGTVDDGDQIARERIYLTKESLNDIKALMTDEVRGQLEFTDLAIAISGVPKMNSLQLTGDAAWDFATDSGSLAADTDSLFASLATSFLDEFSDLADAADGAFERLGRTPVVGEAISESLGPLLDSLFDPANDAGRLRDAMEENGFRVEQLPGLDQIFSGNFTELFQVTYQKRLAGEPQKVTGKGTIGSRGDVHLSIDAPVLISPVATISFVAGIDAVGGLYVVEGSEITAAVHVHPADTLDATVVIPKVLSATASLDAVDDQPILSATAGWSVQNGNTITGERLYAASEGFATIVADSAEAKFAIEGAATATLAADAPKLAGMLALPESLTWLADVTLEFEVDPNATPENRLSGDIDLTVHEHSIADELRSFQESESFEQALVNIALGQFVENHPIPEGVQNLLGTEIPFIQSNVMDLLEIPRATQYLIAPAAFRDVSAADAGDSDALTVTADILEGDNLLKMLQGDDFDIVGLRFADSFTEQLDSITVVPETVVFTWLGVVSAKFQLDVTPGFGFGIDVQAGLDSRGFYVEGAVGDDSIAPHFSVTGSLMASGIVTGNVAYILDAARITVGVGITGEGAFRVQSPHETDSRMRVQDLKKMDLNSVTGQLLLDLNVLVRGELGFVRDDRFDVDAQRDWSFELYKSPEVNLGELQQKIEDLQRQVETEGRPKLIAAAATTGEPHAVASAAALLYRDLKSLSETAKTLIVDHRVDTVAAIRAMAGKLDKSPVEIARALWGHVTEDVGELARGLWKGATKDPGELAEALHKATGSIIETAKGLRAVTDDLLEIATTLRNRFETSYDKIAEILYQQLDASLQETADILVHLGARDKELVDSLISWLIPSNRDAINTVMRFSNGALLNFLGRVRINHLSGFARRLSTSQQRLAFTSLTSTRARTVIRSISQSQVLKVVKGLNAENAARAFLTVSGKTADYLARRLPMGKLRMIAGKMSAAKIAHYINHILSQEAALRMFNALKTGPLTDVLEKMGLGQLKGWAPRLRLPQQVSAVSRLAGEKGKQFLRSLSPKRTHYVMNRLSPIRRGFVARKWLTRATADYIFRKMDPRKLGEFLKYWRVNQVSWFANKALNKEAITKMFGQLSNQTAGSAMNHISNKALKYAVKAFNSKRLSQVIKGVRTEKLEKVFSYMSSRQSGEVLNRVSKWWKKHLKRHVDGSVIRKGRNLWNRTTKNVLSSSGKKWWQI